MGALWVWRQFPREIASDLSEFHHRRIAEWHDGTMSSYELLELLEFMNERGAFKAAAREGELTYVDQMHRYGINEIARLRATIHAVHGGKRYDPFAFKSVAELKAEVAEKEATLDGREHVFAFADRTTDFIDPEDNWDNEENWERG
jgi:hypothetical protein